MNPGASERYHLHWTEPGGQDQDYEIAGDELTIGRQGSAGLVLQDPLVSRLHARIRVGSEGIVIEDLQSRNGTFVNSERVTMADLRPGDRVTIGGSTLEVTGGDGMTGSMATSAEGMTVVAPASRVAGATEVLAPIVHDPDATHVLSQPGGARPEAPPRGVAPDELLDRPLISEQDLRDHGVEVQVVECGALGGGMGSFVWVDLLRNSGMAAADIAVVGNEEVPYGRYQWLCRNSQIPPHERLRSNSDSCPDNPWGFPGYAVREAWGDLTQGHLGSTLGTLWGIFGEPAIAQTYTPRSGDVFRAVDREAARIGWRSMFRFGRLRAIRKTSTGRFLAIASASDEHTRRHFAISARILHLSLGYPSVQFLPDLAEFRDRYGDRRRVVNAYEPHDHIYEQLRGQGGVILLRGRGIVASRILQRVSEERKANKDIVVVHLHRSRLTEGHRYGWSRRQVIQEFEFQPFNWPKGCWTGPQRRTLEKASPSERQRLLEVWGGTTTANRSDWQQIVAEGVRDGWYRAAYGAVRDVTPSDDGRVITRISSSLAGGGTLELPADFVIDCTGLVASPDRSPVLGDLIKRYALPRNTLGRLHVSDDFEVEGMRHGDARMYAAGATTLGGPHAAVDSFLGLQYAAFRAVDAARDAGPRGLRKLDGLYSLSQWLKWARRATP